MALVHSFLSALTIWSAVKACDLSLVATFVSSTHKKKKEEKSKNRLRGTFPAVVFGWQMSTADDVQAQAQAQAQAPKTPVALLTK